jgi:hypothetical protein
MTAGERQGSGSDQVGSVAEEAAKLFSALQDWAGQPGPDHADGSRSGTSGIAAGLRGVTDHVATGGQDCVWCPVCQVIHRVRQSSPEVKGHLAAAASSLLQAVSALLEPHAAPGEGRGGAGVEHIDLDETD